MELKPIPRPSNLSKVKLPTSAGHNSDGIDILPFEYRPSKAVDDCRSHQVDFSFPELVTESKTLRTKALALSPFPSDNEILQRSPKNRNPISLLELHRRLNFSLPQFLKGHEVPSNAPNSAPSSSFPILDPYLKEEQQIDFKLPAAVLTDHEADDEASVAEGHFNLKNRHGSKQRVSRHQLRCQHLRVPNSSQTVESDTDNETKDPVTLTFNLKISKRQAPTSSYRETTASAFTLPSRARPRFVTTSDAEEDENSEHETEADTGVEDNMDIDSESSGSASDNENKENRPPSPPMINMAPPPPRSRTRPTEYVARMSDGAREILDRERSERRRYGALSRGERSSDSRPTRARDIQAMRSEDTPVELHESARAVAMTAELVRAEVGAITKPEVVPARRIDNIIFCVVPAQIPRPYESRHQDNDEDTEMEDDYEHEKQKAASSSNSASNSPHILKLKFNRFDKIAITPAHLAGMKYVGDEAGRGSMSQMDTTTSEEPKRTTSPPFAQLSPPPRVPTRTVQIVASAPSQSSRIGTKRRNTTQLNPENAYPQTRTLDLHQDRLPKEQLNAEQARSADELDEKDRPRMKYGDEWEKVMLDENAMAKSGRKVISLERIGAKNAKTTGESQKSGISRHDEVNMDSSPSEKSSKEYPTFNPFTGLRLGGAGAGAGAAAKLNAVEMDESKEPRAAADHTVLSSANVKEEKSNGDGSVFISSS